MARILVNSTKQISNTSFAARVSYLGTVGLISRERHALATHASFV